ncbi:MULTISPECIES: hypothetical protein [Thermomonosporaceae]|uniref:hypothetical protein n=1 Tax=Thermomonosporaceae TaxID=2012 RepID=UPI00255B27C2|nr:MULTISPECIES: hypothetical protein [Thermomonosporaceae]MDL4775504.1 hypothetical protein [Actinomadura xylanilytica]
MTDPMTIAIATAMAGKAVEVAGEPAREAVAALVQKVKARFRGRVSEERALARATEDPESPERIEELAGVIRGVLDEDPAFGDEVRSLWGQVQTNATATGDGVSNVFNGQAEKVIQLRDVNGGLTIN